MQIQLDSLPLVADLRRWMRNMKFQFREVTHSDLNKFPLWYERIDGPELFSNFIPTTFKTFEDSSVMLWFIIMDDEDETGAIWFEKKNPEKLEIDLGIFLNRTEFFGKGIGKISSNYLDRTLHTYRRNRAGKVHAFQFTLEKCHI